MSKRRECAPCMCASGGIERAMIDGGAKIFWIFDSFDSKHVLPGVARRPHRHCAENPYICTREPLPFNQFKTSYT